MVCPNVRPCRSRGIWTGAGGVWRSPTSWPRSPVACGDHHGVQSSHVTMPVAAAMIVLAATTAPVFWCGLSWRCGGRAVGGGPGHVCVRVGVGVVADDLVALDMYRSVDA